MFYPLVNIGWRIALPGMDDRDALHLFRQIARENRRKSEAGDHAWQGLAFELDLATYLG
jgi:hypothetical protein